MFIRESAFIPCPEIHRGHFCVLLSIHIETTGLDEQEIHVFGTMSSYLCHLCFLIGKWPVGRSVTLALLIRSCCICICICICICVCICISICICICVCIWRAVRSERSPAAGAGGLMGDTCTSSSCCQSVPNRSTGSTRKPLVCRNFIGMFS